MTSRPWKRPVQALANPVPGAQSWPRNKCCAFRRNENPQATRRFARRAGDRPTRWNRCQPCWYPKWWPHGLRHNAAPHQPQPAQSHRPVVPSRPSGCCDSQTAARLRARRRPAPARCLYRRESPPYRRYTAPTRYAFAANHPTAPACHCPSRWWPCNVAREEVSWCRARRSRGTWQNSRFLHGLCRQIG